MREHDEREGFTTNRAVRVTRIGVFRRVVTCISSAALLIGAAPQPLWAQAQPPAQQAEAQMFAVEQLDALMAPVALYPDELLTQLLMACTYPLQVVEAARWIGDPANKALKGDALTKALAAKNWDPSVKSLVPFPQVLAMMNDKLDWMQQVGYAMGVQQKPLMDSVQRLRRQAQKAGQLQTSSQQVVRTEGTTVIIAPAQPSVVYVPTYNPTVVYGAWPYPAYPPVYLPPPPGYVAGTALVAGLAFGAGVAITAGLWGWASPNWGGGNVNVNVNRYNNINVNRAQINNSNWHANRPATLPSGGGIRAPAGPVGAPGRPGGLPANGIGRPSVAAPGNVVRPPSGVGRGNGPAIDQGALGGAGRGQAGNGAANRPATAPRPSQAPARAPGGFAGMNDGNRAAEYGNRGAQSRQSAAQPRARQQGAAQPRGGGGGGRGGRR